MSDSGKQSSLLNVVIMVPAIHFYAPLTLRVLFERCPSHQYTLVTTPKLPGEGSSYQRLNRLLDKRGGLYVFSQILLRS
ncbi:MAG: hypothetical protein ABEJ65_09135, partial [bacterium]